MDRLEGPSLPKIVDHTIGLLREVNLDPARLKNLRQVGWVYMDEKNQAVFAKMTELSVMNVVDGVAIVQNPSWKPVFIIE